MYRNATRRVRPRAFLRLKRASASSHVNPTTPLALRIGWRLQPRFCPERSVAVKSARAHYPLRHFVRGTAASKIMAIWLITNAMSHQNAESMNP